ncbi:MAG: OB-fold domain-containing protein [Acidobacteriota bacterium]
MMREGIVWSETVVHGMGEPYQLALVELQGGGRRLLVRVRGERAEVGERVRERESAREYPECEGSK